MNKVNLSTSEKKILLAATQGPALWYELGERAYPMSCNNAVNIWGQPIKNLKGRAVDITVCTIDLLLDAKLLRKRKDYYYVLTPMGRKIAKELK